MSTTAAEFRTVDTSERLPDDYVNPYYLDDLKRRISVARVGGKLYAFDDLCPHEACPLSAGLLTGTTLKCSATDRSSTSPTGRSYKAPQPTR
jgi:nitrite reductase/ring-hydroxylating ferredoxin subunit